MAINNEAVGIAAEVAIAKSFGIGINPHYAARAEQVIVDLLLKNDNVKRIFTKENMPIPIEHIAEGQNPVDFILSGNKTLSVKTNQEGLGKVAPQIIGQPTAETYFSYLENHFSNFSLTDELATEGMEDTYENRYKCRFRNKQLDENGKLTKKTLVDKRRLLEDGTINPNRDKKYWILE